MSDNTTKIVLHVNNDTGKVEKAEQEDAAGERTTVDGNFDDITLTQDTSTKQMAWRMAAQPATSENVEESSSSSGTAEAPSV